jgi:phosphate transport system permease protein
MTHGIANGGIARDPAREPRRLLRRRLADRAFLVLVLGSVVAVLAPLVAVLGSVVARGAAAIDLDFFVAMPLPVGETGGGIGNALLGSLCLVAGALALAAPVAIPAGVFLASDASMRAAAVVRLAADVLAGVPSIVIGIFAYGVLVLPLKHFSGLAGAFALAVIMLPTLARTTEEVVRMVPFTLTEAAVALGAPRWRVVLRVVLPAASRGVAAGVIAAVARAAGETAPLMFTAFGSPFVNLDPMQPTAAVPLVIFNYAISPYEDWHRMAWAAALVLTVFVLAGSIVSRWAIARRAA